MKTLNTSFIFFATSTLFSLAANASLQGELRCAYKATQYANNQIPDVQMAPVSGKVIEDTDTEKSIEFDSQNVQLGGGYLLRIKGYYMRTGVINNDPTSSWVANAGTVSIEGEILKPTTDGKLQAVAANNMSSESVSSPKQLTQLEAGQASKNIPVTMSLENTEYQTVEANYSPAQMVQMHDQLAQLLVDVRVACVYVQTSN